jgi:hypothetical protein
MDSLPSKVIGEVHRLWRIFLDGVWRTKGLKSYPFIDSPPRTYKREVERS